MSYVSELNKNHLPGCACFACDMTPRLPYTDEEWGELTKGNYEDLCRYCGQYGGAHAGAMNGNAGNCSVAYTKSHATRMNLEKMLELIAKSKEDAGWSRFYFYNT